MQTNFADGQRFRIRSHSIFEPYAKYSIRQSPTSNSAFFYRKRHSKCSYSIAAANCRRDLIALNIGLSVANTCQFERRNDFPVLYTPALAPRLILVRAGFLPFVIILRAVMSWVVRHDEASAQDNCVPLPIFIISTPTCDLGLKHP